MIKQERIDNQTLILGDCLEVMPTLGVFDHIISDPPYESFMHDAKKESSKRLRTDGREEIKALNFEAIDEIRKPFVEISSQLCNGWFIVFCTPEGVGKWADCINESPIKYKRACFWHKPDSTPQLNGQCPAMAGENFIVAWAGKGHSKWNGGGKRGYYKHNTNPPDRHGVHATEKPWRLMAEILLDFTNEGQTILDPFMGSGTTLVACQKLGRYGTGIECDPQYFQIACERVHDEWSRPDMFTSEAKEETPQQIDLLEIEK